MRIKMFSIVKETINRMKRKLPEWWKTSANQSSDKELIFKIDQEPKFNSTKLIKNGQKT